MKIKEFFRKNVEATTASIKFFNEQPLNSLGQIIPVGMIVASMVGFIFAIIKFIIAGGFSNQITALKGDFFGGISEGFTSGTASVLTSGIVSTIISILLFVELLVLIISYYKTESKSKKIVASICLGIGIILFGVAGFVLAVGFGVINISEQMEMKIVEMLTVFDGMQTSTIVNGLKITALIGVVALIVFVILMLVSEHKWMIKNTAIALLLSYIILPLALLLIENIIPMIVGVVAIVVIGGAIFLGGKIFLSGSGESAGGASYSGKTYSQSKTKENTDNNKTDVNQPKYWKIERDAQLWVESAMLGTKVIRAYVQGFFSNEYNHQIYYALIGEPTLYEFKKGDVIITVKGKIMTERDLHYKY